MEDEVNLTTARNWAFLAMVSAAVAAFGTNTRARSAGVPDLPEIECEWVLGSWAHCEQTGGDPLTCSEIAPDVESGDAFCRQICEGAGAPGRAIMPETTCFDGPPLSFECICGLPILPD